MAPEAAASDDDAEPPALPVSPDSRLEMPLVSDFSSGLKASRTARSEIRRASDFKTSSNCLPPVTEAENAWVIARAKPPALAVRSFVFRLKPSSVLDVVRRSVLSVMARSHPIKVIARSNPACAGVSGLLRFARNDACTIRKRLHQRIEIGARDTGRRAAARSGDGVR